MKRIKITLPEGGRRIGELGSNVGLNRGVSFELQAEEIIIEGDATSFFGNVNTSKPEPLPFDLEAAKAGAPLVTRDGRKARFIAHVPESCQSARLIAMIEGSSMPCHFHENGRFINRFDDRRDLFTVPKPKRTVWVNVYDRQHGQRDAMESCAWKSEALAARDVKENTIRVMKTVPVEIDA